MDCRRAGSPCACAPVRADGPASGLLLSSRSQHVLDEVHRVATAAGHPSEWLGRALLVHLADPAPLLLQLDAELTSVEKDDVRAVPVADRADVALLADALVAPTVAALCARLRAPALAGALEATSAFHSVYQPVLDLVTGRTVAWEALLRAEVDGEALMPAAMFATAEQAGWLHVLDRIGRETAIAGAAGWLGSAQLFVNFVPTSVYRPQVCLATTERAARRAGLRMDQLVFEVVESHAVTDLEHLARVLDHYKALGCRVALDDVGAGYSSLTTLVRLQPQVVKLDKALVHGLTDRSAVAVVRSVVSLAHEMGAVVVAECVETADQLEAARDLGVDLAQGWLLGRPTREPGATSAPTLPAARPRPAAPVPALDATSDDLVARAVAATTTGLTIVDARAADLPMVWCNEAFLRLSGYEVADVLGRNCRFLQARETDRVVLDRIAADLAAGRPTGGRLLQVRPDGTTWWNDLRITPLRDASGEVTHFVGVQQDVTALVRAEEHARYLAHHDPLTGLANRTQLHDVLRRETARAERGVVELAVVYLDLDGFKAVNDDHGHVVGDEVLAAVAARLQVAAREGDLLSRVGGDEFVLLVTAPPGQGEAAVTSVANRLAEQLARPIEAAGLELSIGVSVGVAWYEPGVAADALLDRADADMYGRRRERRGAAPV